MTTIIIGMGIGIIIVALVLEPDRRRQYWRYFLPMGALAGLVMAIVLFTL